MLASQTVVKEPLYSAPAALRQNFWGVRELVKTTLLQTGPTILQKDWWYPLLNS